MCRVCMRWRTDPSHLWRAALRALKQVIGAPDYEAYLEHCRAAGHPPGLTEAEYLQEFFDSKGRGVRCC